VERERQRAEDDMIGLVAGCVVRKLQSKAPTVFVPQ